MGHKCFKFIKEKNIIDPDFVCKPDLENYIKTHIASHTNIRALRRCQIISITKWNETPQQKHPVQSGWSVWIGLETWEWTNRTSQSKGLF